MNDCTNGAATQTQGLNSQLKLSNSTHNLNPETPQQLKIKDSTQQTN